MINLEAIPLVGRLLQVEATARVDLEAHGSDGLDGDERIKQNV
jgi:hypothetical protein